MKITYIKHSCFLIETCGKKIVIDPFVPTGYTNSALNNAYGADYILLTHAHGDHTGYLEKIYNPETSQVIAVVEFCNYLNNTGIKKTVDLNCGGSVKLDGITISMVSAVHSSSYALKGQSFYAGIACGYIISNGETSVYHAGDTGIFGDMALINALYAPRIGLLPIGGKYTMDIDAAAYACNNFFNFKCVIPMHYNTFPKIRANPEKFSEKVKNTKVLILNDGETVLFKE